MYIYEAYLPLAGSALAVAGVVAFHEAGIFEYMYVGCMYVFSTSDKSSMHIYYL